MLYLEVLLVEEKKRKKKGNGQGKQKNGAGTEEWRFV
jgi:hypothetical protein